MTNGGRSASIGQGSATVPTPAQAGGNFQGYTTAAGAPVIIYDPATGDANGLGKTPFPNNTIPADRIAPQSTALLKYLGTSATSPLRERKCVSTTTPIRPSQPQNRQSLTVRGDYYQSEKSQYAFRYSSGNEDILSTGLLGAGSKIVTNYYQYMGSNTWTFTPHIVNEARFGYTHFFNSTGLLQAFTNDVVTHSVSPASMEAIPQPGEFQMLPLPRDRRGQQRTSGAVLGIAAGMAPMLSPIQHGRLSTTSHG